MGHIPQTKILLPILIEAARVLVLSLSTSPETCGSAEGDSCDRAWEPGLLVNGQVWVPALHLSLRGAVRRRSNLMVEEIASPPRGSQ
jgi:hypothetical protein